MGNNDGEEEVFLGYNFGDTQVRVIEKTDCCEIIKIN
jgi:hypothetical protein